MVARLDRPPAARAGAALIPTLPAAAESSPLTSDHFIVLADARQRARKVFRAASTATMSGWTTALFAAVTILFGLTDPLSLLLGAGMGAIAYNEFRGAALLRKFDLRAPNRLAIGQLAFGALIVGYAGWSIIGAVRGPSASGSSDPQVDAMLADMKVDGLVRTLSVALYAGVGLVGALVPGLTALYYRTRARHIRKFLSETPDWAVRAIQA